MVMYHDKLYPPMFFGVAAPSVPSFIGSKVSFGWHFCVRLLNRICLRISLKFCMRVYLNQLYPCRVFGGAAPSVPSFIGSKVIFGWHSCFHSLSCICLRISFKFCVKLYLSQLYTPLVFGHTLSVPSFIGSKVIIIVCTLIDLHFCTDFSQILYHGVSW